MKWEGNNIDVAKNINILERFCGKRDITITWEIWYWTSWCNGFIWWKHYCWWWCYQICYNNFSLSDELDVTAAPSGLVFPCAWGAAMEAYHLAQEGKMVSAAALLPSYLRQPQAVRERLAREAEQAAKSSMKKE